MAWPCLLDESGGSWGKAQPLPEFSTLRETSSFPTAVSCHAPGDCTVTGTYSDDSARLLHQVFVASEVQGKWGAPQQLPGTAKLIKLKIATVNGLSCAVTGTCVAVGFITDSRGFRHAIGSDEKNGTWQTTRQPAGVKPVSEASSAKCTSARNCLVAGYSRFVSETLSVTTKARTGGRPGGQVRIVAGRKAICVIKLKAGKGACKLRAKQLKPGTQLTGMYGGSSTYGPSATRPENLTVVK